eukprot:g6549.t3
MAGSSSTRKRRGRGGGGDGGGGGGGDEDVTTSLDVQTDDEEGGGGGPPLVCETDGSSAHYEEFLEGEGSVTVRWAGTITGCPNHVNWPFNPGFTVATPTNTSIPAYPMLIADGGTTDLSTANGAIGIMRNGVAMFSAWANVPVEEYEDTAFYQTSSGFDPCGGHHSASGTYHYHNTAGCLQEQAGGVVGQHSPLLGWAYDGFPFYGQLGPGGVEMKMCGADGAHPTVCLDICSGYEAFTDEDTFAYRYYTSCGYDESFFPFTANCFRGCCPDGVACNDQVEPCGESAELGYSDEHVPEASTSLHDQYDAMLIEGEDVDYIESNFSVNCTLYLGSAVDGGATGDEASGASGAFGHALVALSGAIAAAATVAHRRSSRGSGICNQAGSVHVPLRAISDDQDVPPIVKRRPAERNFISILSEDGTEQALPVASASSFPLWVIDGEIDRAGRKQVTQVPGANEELGWVNPRSYTELWIPEGSPAPTMKLCLGMLMKDGVPRYVMPMVDLVVEKEGRSWRNRGLNSVPIAHAWEPVARAAAGSLFLSAYAEERVEGSETDSIWGSLAEKLPVADAFQDIVSVLADPPEGLDLGSGFHFVVAEVDDAGADSVGPLAVAGPGGRVRVFLSDLSEPADLLDLEETGGVRGVAALGFDVFSVANGGETQRLRHNSALYQSLDDLSALLPKDVLLPQPTLCKVATEEERGVELGRSSSNNAGPGAAVGDSPIFEVRLRVLLSDFRSTSTANFERGVLAALKRGIDDVVENRENGLGRNARPGSVGTTAIVSLVIVGLVVFIVVPLGGVIVVCGLLFVVWCHSRATDETDTSGDAIARSCHVLVAKEEEEEDEDEDEHTGGVRQQGWDEEHGRAGRHHTGVGRGGGGDISEASGGVGGSSAILVSREEEQEDVGFDFFLNGWGFCGPRLQRCCCCYGGTFACAPLGSSLPAPRWGDWRRPALISIKPSKELRAVRLIQLLKFADPRANIYLTSMGRPKASQFEVACPDGSGGESHDREAAAAKGVVLVAAYTNTDDDHDPYDDQLPPIPPTYQSEQVFSQPPAFGCSDERPKPITAASGFNTDEPPAEAEATRHEHPPIPGAGPSRSPSSPSSGAVAVNVAQEREVGRWKTIDPEAALPTADGSSSSSSSNDHDGGKSAHGPSLDALSALLPEEVRLPQPTLCKVTTEEERGVEFGRSSGNASPGVAVGDSPIFEVHLRVLLKDFPTASATHFEKGLIAALKRGIDDVVDNQENNLPPGAKGSLSSKAILYLFLLAVIVFVVLPLGSVCVLCGCVALAWCNSRAKDKANSSGDAVARSCLLLVEEEGENERDQGYRQGGDEERQGEDERQGRSGGHQTGSGGGGRGSSGEAAKMSRQSPTTSLGAEQADAGFDFFLRGWGFCCPSRKGCCCLCGNKRAPLLAPSLSPPPPCVDSRRPALLSVKPSKELRAVRLIQLLKFADPRASAYLGEPHDQELISGLELRPQLSPGHGSWGGLDSPFQ